MLFQKAKRAKNNDFTYLTVNKYSMDGDVTTLNLMYQP